jgi:hypothetical protein
MTQENFLIVAEQLIDNELRRFKEKCTDTFNRKLEEIYSWNRKFTRKQVLSHIYGTSRYEILMSFNSGIFFDLAFEEAFNQFIAEAEFNKDKENQEEDVPQTNNLNIRNEEIF